MSDTVSLTIVFHERDLERIQRVAETSSDPEHPEYGRFLNPEEHRDLVVLPDAERATFVDWLTAQGMTIVESEGANPQLLFLRATREQVTATFGRDLQHWVDKDADNPGHLIHLALPRRFAGYVQKVGALPGEQGQSSRFDAAADTQAPETASGNASEVAPPPPNFAGVTPAQLRDIYSVPSQWDGSGETIALMMLGGRLIQSDMRAFWSAHGIRPPDVRTVYVGPGYSADRYPSHTYEVATSIQWAGALAPRARIVVYFIDPVFMGDPWAAFLFAILNDEEHRPTIASTSWVAPERQYYRMHGHSVIRGLLSQAAAMGITVVSASGDWGTFDGVPNIVQDGRYVSDAPWPHGVFPAVEEHILGVGGTMVTSLRPLTEIGWSGPTPLALRTAIPFSTMAGCGGFSDRLAIPPWQRSALRPYYSRGASAPAVVPYGRGFPDVALMAGGPAIQGAPDEPMTVQGFQAVVYGGWIDFAGGTSISAPIWAAFLALVNQARRSAGLPRLGWPSPLFYRLADSTKSPFRQITHGNSDVAFYAVNDQGQAVTYDLRGYECRPGWNPVTGLGVPNLSALIDAVCEMNRD